jgi:hypothetical protein
MRFALELHRAEATMLMRSAEAVASAILFANAE